MKTKLGAVNCLYPMPTVLVGATVNGKPNFITSAPGLHGSLADGHRASNLIHSEGDPCRT